MAKVEILHQYPDGEVLSITVTGKRTYPDAMDQMRAVAMEMHAEAVVMSRDFEDVGGDE